MSKTITRLFDNYSDAAEAVRQLEGLGIPHDNISIVANNAHGEHSVPVGVNDHGDVSRATSAGAVIGGGAGLLAGLGLLAVPGLGPIVAAGWLAATAVGAGVGAVGGAAAGGIVGTLRAAGHSEEDAQVYAEGVRRGGTLVSAKVDAGDTARAEAVLDRSPSVNIVERRKSYQTSGWTSFDDTAPAYTVEEIETDRTRHGIPSRN